MENKKFSHTVEKIKTTEKGEMIRIRTKILMNLGFIENVICHIIGTLDIHLEYKRQDDMYAYFEATVELPTKAVYRYSFEFWASNYEKAKFYQTEEFKMSINFCVAEWAKGAVMYQIFIDRFKRNNKVKIKEFESRSIRKWSDKPVVGADENGNWTKDFYGGNFPGIEEKLDYIKKLNVDIIYLSPISKANTNHKYNGEDLEEVDPYFGSKEDLMNLIKKIHEKGMKVIVDVVYNHVGNDSKYFNQYGKYPTLGAYQSKESSYFDFFKTYEKDGKIYYDYWWQDKTLVVCDKESKAWQNYICGVGGNIDLLFSYGIDGIRVDVADDLTDDFLAKMRSACKRNKKDAFILLEVWKDLIGSRGYIESGKCGDSAMNYYFNSTLIDYLKINNSYNLNGVINNIKSKYPVDTILSLMNFTSTHDISRMINMFVLDDQIFKKPGEIKREYSWTLTDEADKRSFQKYYEVSSKDYRKAKKLAKLYMLILNFWPGCFSIFYGDEVGVQGLGNLANRTSFPWNRMDKDLLKYTRRLTKIRKNNKFLKNAETKVLVLNEKEFIFQRELNEDKFIVIVNNSKTEEKIIKREKVVFKLWAKENQDEIIISPKGAVVIKK